jgi:hypothetical protein
LLTQRKRINKFELLRPLSVYLRVKRLLLLLALFSFVQANAQKLFEERDSVLSNDGRIFYSYTKGYLKGRKRVGAWKRYQSSTADTNLRVAWSATYEKGKLLEETHYTLDSYTVREYKSKYVLKREANYRYGKIVSERLYEDKTTMISKTYYADGELSGVGKEVLVEIIAGCDAGMRVYQKLGVWKYYDSAGKKLDDLEHKFNTKVFKRL